MTDIRLLVRKHIRGLIPYSSARDEFKGKAEVFLDANENSLGSALKEGLNRYPDPQQSELKRAISRLKQVGTERIFLGNGSDEAIDLLIRAFCEPGSDHLILMPPTYGMYAVSAAINNISVIEVPLTRDFNIDIHATQNRMVPNSKLIFICSPNNPSGNLMNRQAITSILEAAPGLVIVDEAYIDFSLKGSLIPWLEHYPHLVILQTLSKAWGLANIRLGMVLADPFVIDVLNHIKPPYNVSGITQQAALDALHALPAVEKMVNEIITQKHWLEHELTQLASVDKIYPSDANFILVRFIDAPFIFRSLTRAGIIVRDRTKALHCDNCLRITVGKADENKKLIDLLKKLAR